MKIKLQKEALHLTLLHSFPNFSISEFKEKKLCSLHWLPVKFRVDFKILLLTSKAFLRSVRLVT